MAHALKRAFLRHEDRRRELRSQMTPERRKSARERMLLIAEENMKARSGPKAAAPSVRPLR